METYVHGGDIYRDNIEMDFSANINPLGMPEAAIAAAVTGIRKSIHYPDWKSETLVKAISAFHGIPEDEILPGNGAAELIYALCLGFRPESAWVPAPGFQEYEAALTAAGASVHRIFLEESNGFRVDQSKDVIDVLLKDPDIAGTCTKNGTEGSRLAETTPKLRMLFLCNPNNPTGQLLSKTVLKEILSYTEKHHIMVAMDECFLPFLPDEQEYSMLSELKNYQNLVIFRAFTKIYGMPGLRLGYAVSGNREILHKMRRVLQPWNVSIPAQMAGTAALGAEDFLTETRALVRKEREYLENALSHGLAEKVYPGSVNYVFFRSRPDLKEKLREKGILIRSCGNYAGLDARYFRICVKTHPENEMLIRKWKEIVWQNPL
ncbi:MAG: pyridoxal phosphate-dependent class II aminotransferase [Oribacterium sp.]|nr:pyridoxal phosphate-dependent class II aminotransferase [Oribacterium sp.]